MKLAARIFVASVVVVVTALAVDAYLSMRREVRLFDRQITAELDLVGRALAGPVADALRNQGDGLARRLVADANLEEGRVRVRWVRIDAAPSDPDAPRLASLGVSVAAATHRSMIRMKQENGAEQFIRYVPIPDSVNALELSADSSERDAYVRRTIAWSALVTLALLGASAALAAVFGVRWIGHPLSLLQEKARRAGEGDLSAPVLLPGRGELSELAASMNAMCDQLALSRDRERAEAEARIRTLEQLRHADRLRTVGTLAAGVAHELGTPLNVVSGRAALIASGELPPVEVTENARIIHRQSDRMTQIIRQLLDLARSSAAGKVPIDLAEAARRAAGMLRVLARNHGASVDVDAGEPVVARADEEQIQQVISNLVVNALHAMPPGGHVWISAGRETARPPSHTGLREGRYAWVAVRDDGPGIRPEHLERIFEPFFTTKGAGSGTGLGLSIAQGIVRDHGGWIEVTSELEKGSCFRFFLPEEAAA
jgi:signal transduction histidine kinase